MTEISVLGRLAVAMATPVDADEYSEFAMAVRAPIYVLPVLIIMLAWDWSSWVRALAIWVIASIGTYSYGYWMRDES
jgi:hypothetical protein